MSQLSSIDQFTVDQAEKALAASQQDTDTSNYPHHLGALEFQLAKMIDLVSELTGNA